jgi:hypothetical protein
VRRLRRLLFAGAAAVTALTAAAGAGEPQRPYRADLRALAIDDALAALRAADPAALEHHTDYARALQRGPCAGGTERLRVECMTQSARRYCKERGEPRCEKTMDIVLCGVLADDRLIPPEERYRIVRENKDYRRALARELARIRGTLAVDFRLREGSGDEGASAGAHIDRYCREAADDTHLSYTTCVASLVLYIARAG